MIFPILAQLIIPLALIIWFAIAPPRNLLGLTLQAVVTAIALFAIARMGLWLFPPWWMPYIYGLLFVAALAIGLQRLNKRRGLPSTWLGWIAIVGWVAFGVFAVNEAIFSWMGQFSPPIAAVELAFPLRGEGYLVANGGNERRINVHMEMLDESVPRFRAYRGSSYGVDIVRVDRWGLRAPGLAPSDPKAYQIYGEPAFAPCTGKVAIAVDGLPDMTVPQIDEINHAGNHVLLRCNDVDVLLAHFRSGSLLVKAGIQVKVGDMLAEVGNSGESSEPHLHIHAQRPGSPAAPFSGDPVPMRFQGRFLSRGDLVQH